MMLKRLMLAAVLFATPAFACQEDVAKIPGLNDTERAALVAKCESAKTTVVAVATDPQKVASATTEAISVGKQAAEVVREVAQELSIQVNEFITTPVGVLATGVAIWYFAGDEVGSVIGAVWSMFGGLILFVVATVIGTAIRKSLSYKETVESVQKGWFGSEKTVQRKVYSSFRELDSDMQFATVITALAQVITYTVAFAFIF